MFASNYLQQHLLTLPAVPTLEQFQKLRDQREREALERMRELEQQREEQRQLLLMREAKEAATVDSGLRASIREMVSFKKDEELVEAGVRRRSEGGWMCASGTVTSSADFEDPFVLQRDQLVTYIAQARQARRQDEVQALEQSLRDIEKAMEQQQMSYGIESHR